MYNIHHTSKQNGNHTCYVSLSRLQRRDRDKVESKQIDNTHPRLRAAFSGWRLTHGCVRHDWGANKETNCNGNEPNNPNPDLDWPNQVRVEA